MATDLAVGVVGAGQVAERHVEAYQANPATRVVAVVDPVRSRADALAARCGATAFDTLEDALAAGALDAISVCVPHDLHLPVARLAAAARVHLLMEKPIATTLEDADAMIAVVEDAGVRMMLGFVHRFRTEVQEARRLLDEGAIGAPASLLDRFCSLGGEHTPGWTRDREQAGGGVLMYGGIHAVDRLLWLLGAHATSVDARARSVWGFGDVEDSLTAVIDLDDGSSAVLFEQSPPFGRPGGWRTEIFGAEGSLRIQTGEWVELTSARRRLTLESRDENHFQREIDEFVAALVEDREPSVPAAAGRESLAVALALYESAARKEPVTPAPG
jgi:predicted dehydrogenase